MAKRKSIMQDRETGQCYLCRLLHGDYSIKPVRQEHHVMGGTANRRLSEKYGLKVWLDLDHHLYGPEAVHRNAEVSEILHREAQRAFEGNYPDLDFMEIFGKNYLTENERAYERNARFRQDADPWVWAKLKKLKEYNNLEEQGKLHCAVGDTVYYRYDGMKIAPMRVEEIIIADYGTNLLLVYCGNDEKLKYWKINIESTAIDNKIVFLTREEAEDALKELKSGGIE